MQRLTPLIELTFSDASTVDRDAGVIRNVRVLGRTSRNGREYSDRALSEAAAHYEGIGVNLNHPDRRTSHLERPVEAGFGWLEAVAVKDDGVYADLCYLRSHPQAAVIVEAAERNPRRFGLSHNAEGKVARRDGKTVVESIERVRSVDVVQNPATNSGLFESEDKMPTRTVKDVIAHRDPRLAALFEDGSLAGYADAPVDEPVDEPADDTADDTADDQSAAAFKALIGAVLDDGSLDLAARLSKIGEILKAHDKLTGGGPRVDGGDGPPVAESAAEAITSDPAVRQLLERIVRIETDAASRALLESHRRSCDATRLAALAALATDDERLRLIESWPERPAAGGGLFAPRPLISRPLAESEALAVPKDAKALALALR